MTVIMLTHALQCVIGLILLSLFYTANVLIKCTFSLFQTGCFLNNPVSLTETDN